MYNIDIGLMNYAYMYFLLRGYTPLSAPMLVDEDIVSLTLPDGNKPKQHLDKFYVGSAEQSFYQLMKDGFEPDGSYMMITPCQRDETPDESHLEIFLKLELVSTVKSTVCIAKDAHDLYEFLGEDVEMVKGDTPLGYDLEIGGVEVGSYGSRIYMDRLVAYGTGLALPRFSQARKSNKPTDY
jgi:hypothetical protein